MNISKDENDNIYLSINLNEKDTLQGNGTLQYQFTNNEPILNKPNDYYFSVIKFNLPLQSVPISIVPIQPNQANPNLTSVLIGIEYFDGVNLLDNYQYVTFQPQNLKPAPVQNQPTMVITDYYFIYSYDWMIKLINNSLSAIHNTLFPANPIAPYFFFDSATELISLVVPAYYCTLTAPFASIPKIYINYSMLKYLDAFNNVQKVSSIPNQIQFYIDLSNYKDINAYGYNNSIPTNPPQYYKFTQSAYSLYSWAAIRRIIITSNSLPIKREFVIPLNKDSAGLESNKIPVITDFSLTYDRSDSTRSVASFLPTPQYRLIDMASDIPMYRFDFSVYWEDVDQNQYYIILPFFQTSDWKFAFFKKSLYKKQ